MISRTITILFIIVQCTYQQLPANLLCLNTHYSTRHTYLAMKQKEGLGMSAKQKLHFNSRM